MKGIVAQAFAIVVVSIVVLFTQGLAMIDPFFLLPLSCFSAVLVGPVVIALFRADPSGSVVRLLRIAVTRASVSVWLILALSLALVNGLLGEGRIVLPTLETALWAFALSVTAAFAVAAAMVLLVSRLSLSATTWAFRAVMLSVVMIYWGLPPAWPISWYALVNDWGLSLVAFGWWLLFASVAAFSALILKRRHT